MTLELKAASSDCTDIAGLGITPSLFCFSRAMRSRNLLTFELGLLSVGYFASEAVALGLVAETLINEALDEFNE